MIRPDYILFGYRVVSFEEWDKELIIKMFLKHNISVRFKGNTFLIKERELKRISKLLGSRVKFKTSQQMGLRGFVYRNRKRYGVICALLFTSMLLLISSFFVWDVRIEGCESGKEEEIVAELSESGLSVGSLWHKTDRSKVENSMLLSSDLVSWVNINRRGNVAYVKVVDKIINEPPEEKTGYSNIVASCDGIVEEITVVKGVAVVKSGETVRRGQLLISGILPPESGGGFCYAEGTVTARINDTVKAQISDNEQIKVTEENKTSRISVNILGFDINIFKSYRNFNKEYDIIEKRSTVKFFGKDIPVFFSREIYVPYTYKARRLTTEEMVEAASLKMRDALAERTARSTVLRVKTEGGFYDGEYILSSDLTLLEDISRDLAFTAP